MSWILLTGISVLSRAVYGVMTKILSGHVHTSVYTQAALLSAAGALISLCVSPLLGGIVLSDITANITIATLVAISQGLGNIVYFVAIKRLTNGTAQISFSSILIFNTLIALVFLDLNLSFVNTFGILLLLVAILAVSSGSIEFDSRGVALMVFAAFLFSVFQIASADIAPKISAATYLLIAYGGAATVVFLLKAKTVTTDVIYSTNLKNTLGIPLLAAVPSIGNFLFAYYAYRIAPEPGKVAILLTSQVVVSVILSYFFLREHNYVGRKLGAAVLVFIAAALIKD